MLWGLLEMRSGAHTKRAKGPYRHRTQKPHKKMEQPTLQEKAPRTLRKESNHTVSHNHTPQLIPVEHMEQSHGLGLLLALESRIMFDGAALLTGAEVVQDQTQQDQPIQDITAAPETKLASNALADPIDLASALSSISALSERREIVFIDTRVDDYQTLMSGISPSAETILLDSTRDGIEQITEILRSRSDIDAIHLIAEGNEAELHLGTTFLTQEAISGQYAGLFTQIGQSLSENADLLIYGCNFGQGEAGRSAMEALAELTGSDIAASTDRTGHTSEYADWELERATGVIETSIVINEATQEAWEGVLATYTVTTTADGGPGSLRQAIIDANTNPGTDLITFSGSGTYLLTLSGAGEDAAAAGDLDITDDLIIVGNGTGNTVIDASGFGGTPDRVFHLKGTSTASISGLTIQGGDQNNGGGILVDDSSTLNLAGITLTGNNQSGTGSGGAIHVRGTANLFAVQMSGNTADNGGAISFDGAADSSLTNVTISGNTATGNGGGIYNNSTITVNRSTINGNSATLGGGIYNEGTIDISNSTVSGNMADTGAGVYNDTTSNGLTFTNVTVSGNMATFDGGGVYTEQAVTMANSTLTLNSADSGGGIRTLGGGGDVDLLNTIVGGNTVVTANPDLDGNFTTSGFNLIGDGTGQSDLVHGVNNDQVGNGGSPINPLLGGLADNGGPTLTHALLVGSPAIDAGTAIGAPTVDQRGVARDASVDIGAFESTTNATPPVASPDSYTIDEDTTLTTEPGWFNEAWLSRQKLTFNNTAQTENLTDFPVLITLDAGNIDYTKVQDAGEDLRFVDADGTELAYEIESWNESGTSYIWVKVPQIDGASGTDHIWMYYDNASATDNQNAAGVWSNSFESLSHLHDDFTDSTGNAHNGINNGSSDSTGNIGDGQSFDGVDDRIDISSDAGIDNFFAGGATVSAWINPSGWGEFGFGRILDKGNAPSATNGWALQVDNTGNRLIFEFGFSMDAGRWRSSINSIALDTWQLVTLVYDSTSAANDPTIYVNGVPVGVTESNTPNGTANSDAGLDLAIGNRSGSTDRTFQGMLDEIRLETGTRSADWIQAQYLSMTDAFVTFATSEGPGGVLTNDTDADGDPLTAIQVNADPANAQSFILNPDGSFSYTPVANFTGIDTFTYTVNDGTVDGNTVTVTINVNPVNDAPLIATNTGSTVNEGSSANVLTTAMLNEGDPDDAGTGLTYTVTAVPTNGTLRLSGTALDLNDIFTQNDIDNNRVTYDHNGSETTTDTFNFSLADGGEDGAVPATGTFNLTVNSVNDPPTFTGLDHMPIFTEGGGTVILDNNATIADPELDAANSYDGATLTLARNGGANGEDLFDGKGTLSSLMEGGNIVQNGTIIGTVTTNSGGMLVLTFNGNATTTLVNDALQKISYANTSPTPPANVQIDFTFNDGNTGSQGSGTALVDTGSITVTINAMNTPPTLDLDANDNSGAMGNDYHFTFTEGDGPTAIADSDASLIDPDSGSFANVILAISGLQDGKAETLIIGGDIFSLDAAVAGQNTSDGNYHVVITTSAGTATVTITRQSPGTLTETQVETLITSIQYQHTDTNTPTSGDRFVDVTVNDGSSDSAAARSTIHVTAINTPPTAAPDAFTVSEGSITTLNLASNDTDADDGLDLTSITIIAGPTNGTITQINTDGTVEYTHNGSEIPTDSFTYAINDLSGATSNTATVNITVTPQNDAPIIISDGGGPNASASVLTGQTFVTVVTATDAESTPLTYSIIGGADAALFSIDTATGMLTFDNAPNIQTPSDVGGDNVYDVIVQASDGTATDTQAIAVTVTDIPVVVPPPPPDPPPESPPPPDEGDKQEELPGGGGFFVTGSQEFRSSSGSNSMPEERKDSESFNISRGDNLLALQSINNKNTLGNAANKLFTLLQKEFETIDFKSELQSLLNPSSGLLNSLDQARDTLNAITETEKIYMVSSIAASTGLSVGYVIWLLRSGVLLTALLSTVPAWQFVNPLLVLDAPARKKNKRNQSEDDSLETMFEKPNKTIPVPPEMKTGTIRQSRWPRQS